MAYKQSSSFVSGFAKAGLFVISCLLGGCAVYHTEPLHPAQFARRFSERNLDNSRLVAFIRHQPIVLPVRFPRNQNLATLMAAGWYYSSALRVQLAKLAVDRANMITASELPNPTVAVSPAYAAQSPAGMSPWLLGFDFDIPIQTAGRREDRMAQAAALTQAGRFDLGQIAWNVRRRIREALVNYLFAKSRVRLLRKQAQDTMLIQSLTESRLQAGDISRPVFTAVKIQSRQTARALIKAQGLAKQRQIELAGALSVPVRALAAVRLDDSRLMNLPPVNTLQMNRLNRTALINRMDIQSLLAQYRAAEAALKLQIARQYPNIHLGPGYRYDQGENKFAFGFTVAIPVFNQNQGAIAAANARRKVIAAELNQKQTTVITRIGSALAGYRSALHQWHTADNIASQSLTELRATRSAFKSGAQSRLALAKAQLEFNKFSQAASQSRLAAVLALGKLEDVLEDPLDNTPALPKGVKP